MEKQASNEDVTFVAETTKNNYFVLICFQTYFPPASTSTLRGS